MDTMHDETQALDAQRFRVLEALDGTPRTAAEISERCGLSIHRVRRALRQLGKAGLATVTHPLAVINGKWLVDVTTNLWEHIPSN